MNCIVYYVLMQGFKLYIVAGMLAGYLSFTMYVYTQMRASTLVVPPKHLSSSFFTFITAAPSPTPIPLTAPTVLGVNDSSENTFIDAINTIRNQYGLS